MNRKLAVLNVSKEIRLEGMLKDDFSTDLYDIRTNRFIYGNTSYIENTLTLQTPFGNRYETWLKHIQRFLATVPNDVTVYFLWIPHCAQVNDYYLQNMKSLGAEFKDEELIQKSVYPFFNAAKKDLKAYTNVRHLNPLEYFRMHDTIDNRIYFLNDPHLNYYGNEVLSEFLEQQLPLKN